MRRKAKNKITHNDKKTKESNQKLGYVRPEFWPALLANLLVYVVLGYFYWLVQHDKTLYEWSLQEDEYVEWATAWAFILASGVCIIGAFREQKFFHQCLVLQLKEFLHCSFEYSFLTSKEIPYQ